MIRNPFRGTRSFTEAADDWPLFGQRDAEVTHLVACLRNFNVTVLFGDNGVGKTSLLRAGLLSHLLHEAQENTKTLGAPIIGVALLPSSADDSPDLAGPHEAILSALNEFVRSASFVITPPDGPLAFHETLVYLSQGLGGFRRRGAIFIILDAFEEYLQHTPSNRSVGDFLLALSHIVYAMDINVNLLLSVRSSAFSELSKIRHFFPDIFDHAVELLSFNSQQAASVIRSTIDVYNDARANEEPVAYCEDIAVSYVTSGLTSASTARRSATRSRQSNATQDDIASSTIETSTFIEPVCLQIVMSHLWEVSLTQWDKQGRVGNINIMGSTLKQLGGVERIFYRYLDARVQALPERTKEIVVALFPYLVAPASATGIAHHIDDLFEYFSLATHRYGDACSKDDIAGALRSISRGQNRILRELPGERFEVFASPLRLPIIEWVQRHKELQRLLALTLHAKQQFAQSQIGAITEVLKCARQVKEGIQRRVGIEGHPAVFTIITTLREMLVNIREKPLYAAGMGTPTAGPVRSVAIVGQVPLVLAGHADGSIVIRKLQKGRGAERIPEIEQVNEGSLLAIDCWGRALNLVAAGFWSGRATICNVLTRQRFIFNHDSPVWVVRISPDGHMLATGSGDGMVRIWPIGKGRPWTSAAHANVVHFVDFSADSAYLLSVSWDGRVRLTDTSSHLSVVSALEEALFYTGTVCSNARTLVAAGTWGGRVYLFDERMCCIRRFRAHKAIIAGMKFLRTESDNPYLLTVSWDGTAREWAVSERGEEELVAEFSLGPGPIHSVAVDDQGHYAASALWDGAAHIWDLSSRRSFVETRDLVELTGHQSAVFYVSFSPDGQSVVTAARDGRIRLWNLQRGSWKPGRRPFLAHKKSVYCVSFSPCLDKPPLLATASHDGRVKVWSTDGSLVAECSRDAQQAHNAHVYRVVFSPDGRSLATASEDGALRLWSISGERRCEARHAGPVYSVRFDPLGKCFVTSSADCTIRFWESDAAQPILLLSSAEAMTRLGRPEVATAFRAIDFSPDGSVLASLSESGFVILWHLNRDRDGYPLSVYPEKFFQAHTGLSFSVHFSPNKPLLATAAWDGCVRLWDTDGRQQAEYKDHRSWVYNAVFSPDGQWIATASADGTAKLRRLITTAADLDHLIERASAWLG